MRVLFVAPGMQAGSHMPFVRREAEALRALGIDVHVESFDNRSYLSFFSEVFRLRRAAKGFDLIHAQFGKFAALAAAFAGAPLVVTFRGTDINHNAKYSRLRSLLGRAASQLAACLARGVVCVSEEIRAKVLARRFRPSLVLPTGVDLKVFFPRDRAQARSALRLPPDEKIVLFNAGRNPEVKDPQLARAAVDCAASHAGPIRLVVLDGSAPPHDVPLYMSAADALILTSRTEGSPTVVQEAMACDLPVVSVNVGDVRERLAGVSCCEVVHSREAAAIGTALARVLAEGKRSDGRVHAAALDTSAIAKKLAEFYVSALEWDPWAANQNPSGSSRPASASTSPSRSPPISRARSSSPTPSRPGTRSS